MESEVFPDGTLNVTCEDQEQFPAGMLTVVVEFETLLNADWTCQRSCNLQR